MIRVAVLASGEGTNLQALLDAGREGRLGGRVVAVVSDRPGARALERARAAGVPAHLLDPAVFPDRAAFDRTLLDLLGRYEPDLVALAGFMRLLGPEVVARYRHRMLNIHPTLLPSFPGLHAHRQVLRHGVKVSGCTIHFVDEGTDSGPIVLQAAVPVAEDDTEETLAARVQRLEHRLYPLAVRLFAEGRLRVEGRRVHVDLRPEERAALLAGLPAGAVVGPLGAVAESATAAAAGAGEMPGEPGRARRRALVSVSDRRGLEAFCRALAEADWEIVATGGTARALAAVGIDVTPAESLTGFGEMLGGRVKTLHPAIHAGILARRDRPEDLADLEAAGILPFDLVVCNLYPFEAAAEAGAAGPGLLEQIDIGGPAMIRAAAKNWPSLAVVVDPDDYPLLLPWLRQGQLPGALRQWLAVKAFRLTAYYDAVIAMRLAADLGASVAPPSLEAAAQDAEQGAPSPGEAVPPNRPAAALPERLAVPLVLRRRLRYGENPHQAGALYGLPLHPPSLAEARPLQGKELSYTNLLDADAAWRAARDFPDCCVVAVKHATPCGIAIGATPAEAFRRAREADPVSIFGGIVAFNRPVDGEAAVAMADVFLEVVVAPAYTDEARGVLARRRNLRVLAVQRPDDAGPAWLPGPGWELRGIDGGVLLQERDWGAPGDDPTGWRVVTRRSPEPGQFRDLVFAWFAVKHVRSNAIVVAADGRTLGIGGGQTSRVAAVEQALARAGERASGAVLASDAFFPFPDAVDLAARAGIAAIVQPGGSVRDPEVIAAADAAGIAMVFTGVRHFRH